MNNHSFTIWLNNEVITTRCMLINLYEQQDKLKYIEGPRIEKEYMDKIGTYEENVIKEEIECELLRKKQQLIQTALNRREPIDELKIDAEIEKMRQQMFQEAIGQAPQEYAQLSDEQSDELQKLYHSIVKNFHPQTNTNLTNTQRELFQKAQKAYQCKDLTVLKLIHEMLYNTKENDLSQELLIELLKANSVSLDTNDSLVNYTTDYSLASTIFRWFKHTDEETIIFEKLTRYRQLADNIEKEMADMQSKFPYNASEILSDPEKLQAYKEELAYRLNKAIIEKERLTKENSAVIERGAKYE